MMMGLCNAQPESVKSELKMCKADAGGADAESRKKLARAAGDEDKMKAKEEGETPPSPPARLGSLRCNGARATDVSRVRYC